MSSDKEVAKKPEQNTAVAVVDFGEHAGTGFENVDASHMSIPYLNVLQDLSPQVKKKSDNYIEGAEPGRMFNTVTLELLPETVHFVACYVDHVFVEWVPREKGGGLVATHADDSDFVAEVRSYPENAGVYGKLKTADGNDLIETFYVYGMLLDSATSTEATMPIVIACTSTKIKPYKSLITSINTIKGLKNPPLYGFRLAINTKDEVNKANQPYSNIIFSPAVGKSYMESLNLPGSEYAGLLAEGMELFKAIKSGNAKAVVDSQDGAPASDGDEAFV